MEEKVRLIPYRVNETFMAKAVSEIPEGVAMIQAPDFWEKGKKGKGVKIAIIDSGCDTSHPDLEGRILGGRNFTSDDGGNPEIYTDYAGHGTHVAGTIAAIENGQGVVGVAPEAELLILKALAGEQGIGDYEWIINAISYAIEQKVDIISMSLSGSADVEELHKVIQKAVSNNILVVCAAGNDGQGDTAGEIDDIAYPACYNEVISVGAVNKNRRTSEFTSSNNEVDLVAPGENILSTFPKKQYANLSGTSMATPHVTGALALIINWAKEEFQRELSEAELYAQLVKRTLNLDYKKTVVGNGFLYLTIPELVQEYVEEKILSKGTIVN